MIIPHDPGHGRDHTVCNLPLETDSIRDIAERFKIALLFVSSDYDDFARICDRVLVFRYGAVIGELEGSTLTQERIIEACYSTASAPSAPATA